MRAFEAECAVRVPLPASAGLQFNNLSAGGGQLLFSQGREALAIPEAQVSESSNGHSASAPPKANSNSEAAECTGRVTGGPGGCLLYFARFVHLPEPLVVIGVESTIQIWDSCLQRMQFTFALPQHGAHATSFDGSGTGRPIAARAATAAVSADGDRYICIGTLAGSILFFEHKKGSFRHVSTVHEHRQPITALGSEYESSRGSRGVVSPTLISADDEGKVLIWSLGHSGQVSLKLRLAPGTGVPVVGVGARPNRIITASANGVIRIYSMVSEVLRMEIQAHSRLMSALDIHPFVDAMASGAEDGTLLVLSIPEDDEQVRVLLCAVWPNAPVTGVTFCGPGHLSVAASAYDHATLMVWPKHVDQ